MAPGTSSKRIASLRESVLLATTVAVFWLVCRLWFAFETPRPLAFVHDEFSYLLAADTFAHGRLTNPAPARGRFFESPHILVRPTYASKYWPGQGLILALGQRLFGSPFWGVVIEGAAIVFIFTLMLCAWVSAPWAITFSAAIAIYFLPPMYWVNSYWGGCAAAAGAGLVLFGLGRHRLNRWPLTGGAVGFGLAVLFLTRPYEGGVFAAAALAGYGLRLWRESRSGRQAGLARAALLGVPILAVAILWTGYYNKAVTGSALEVPYLLHSQQYTVIPPFWFLPLKAEPHYSHPRLAAQHGTHGWEARAWRDAQGGRFNFLWHAVEALLVVLLVLGPLGAMILLLPLALRDSRVRLIGFITGMCILSLALETAVLSHYAAPAAAPLAVLLAIIAESASGLRRFGKPVGLVLAVTIVLSASLFAVVYHARKLAAAPNNEFVKDFAVPRQQIVERLSKLGQKQLVIVHYPSPDWNIRDEWVYNRADIDNQPVVFAHDLGRQENESLLSFYRDRKAWLLVPGDKGYSLEPYPAAR